MSQAENPTAQNTGQAPKQKRGAPPGHQRISPVPPPPVTPYPEWAVLDDQRGPLGQVLWRVASDVLLWHMAAPAERGKLFQPADADAELLADAISEAPSLADSLRTLCAVHRIPGQVDVISVAEACAHIARWAETAELKTTAIQFAELAARMQPDSSVRSFIAGRLCRRNGEHQRAAVWYRRALRLGRLAKNQIDIANAQLGMGNLESDLGNTGIAEQHFWKAARAALRNGRRSLAAAAFHNLIGVTYDVGRKGEALEHFKSAAQFYRPDHPRLPAFAYDAGFFLMREGYYSSALLVFETLLPWVEGQRVSILVRSALARSAAAVRDHIRYQRQTEAVLAMIAVDSEDSENALYQLAEGARSFQDWDRAHALATRALALANQLDNATIARYSVELLEAINARASGDIDRVPPEGDPVDATTQDVLRKLKKRPAQPGTGGALPPEQYPTE